MEWWSGFERGVGKSKWVESLMKYRKDSSMLKYNMSE